jgi:hypothetical protein
MPFSGHLVWAQDRFLREHHGTLCEHQYYADMGHEMFIDGGFGDLMSARGKERAFRVRGSSKKAWGRLWVA